MKLSLHWKICECLHGSGDRCCGEEFGCAVQSDAFSCATLNGRRNARGCHGMAWHMD